MCCITVGHLAARSGSPFIDKVSKRLWSCHYKMPVRVELTLDLMFPKSRPMLFFLNMKLLLENNKLLSTQQAFLESLLSQSYLHHKLTPLLGLMSLSYWHVPLTEGNSKERFSLLWGQGHWCPAARERSMLTSFSHGEKQGFPCTILSLLLSIHANS